MNTIHKRHLTVIIFVKLVLIFIFSSQYNSDLFSPFLNSISFENLNPWSLFYEKNLVDHFPYHGLMLLILAPFAFLGELLNISDSLIKIPLLIADLGILYVLLKFFPRKVKKIYLFYFLNPIILYAIYIHSQLDIIPTALFFISVYMLRLKKIKLSALFFGFALATKLHVIIALPLILIYLYKVIDFNAIIKYTLIAFLVLFLIDLPFLFSDGFIHMVLLNPKQSLIFDAFYNIGSVKLLFPVFAILMIYLHFFNQKKVNQDLLFFYFGILFTSTIFFIYPGPAWYVWMIPFISIYFIQNKNKNKALVLHFTFSFSYLLFIIFFYESEYVDILFLGDPVDLKIQNENLKNISFTFLEVFLVSIMYAFYKYGIKSNSIYNIKTNLSIGIGGDSAVGKTSLLNNLKDILGNRVLQIEGDGEHKWERGNENWKKYTHLDPKANYMHKQADVINKLKHNKIIFRKEYDHSTGQFTIPLKVEPKEFIIIAGLHPFYLPKLRSVIDIKIYIDTDESLRRHWKILRDTKKRGYTIDQVLSQIEKRMDDAEKYIYPQKNFADLILFYFPLNKIQLGKENQKIDLGLKFTFDASINMDSILEKLSCDYKWDYNNDLKSQFIELNTTPKDNFKNIAIETIDNLNELISENAKWHSGYDGLIQLLNLKLISEKLKGNRE